MLIIMIGRNIYYDWFCAASLPGTRVCGTLHDHDLALNLTIWSGIGQAGPVKLGKQRGSWRGTQSRQQGVLLPLPLPLPRSVITASKLIFIFDKKTRREEEQPGETEKQKFLLFWVVASVAVAVVGQINAVRKKGKHFSFRESEKCVESRPTVVEERRVEAGMRCKSDSIIIKALFLLLLVLHHVLILILIFVLLLTDN